ncbi:MAG: 5'/3'-nucleotidase SurE [Pseudomonadota bacterium]
MRILLTNDDGVHAPGLAVLLNIARQLSDDIWIVAPSEENSGAGHSLTLSRPLRVRRHGDRHYSVDGTPTDSVLMAVAKLMKDSPPDLILSGVNRGGNLAEDVSYSGTVSAAVEGALAGIPSIALSQCYSREGAGNSVSFETAENWGVRVLQPLIALLSDDAAMPARTLLNVNFPACAAGDVAGIRSVALGRHDYGRVRIITNQDPRGFDYHWFGLAPTEKTPEHSSDLEAVSENHISVTPLHLDMTHYASLELLESRLAAATGNQGDM